VKFEKVLYSLHPQQVCSLLAVIHGAKPSAIVESVLIESWKEFVHFILFYKLSLAYEACHGFVFLLNSREAYLVNKSTFNKPLSEVDFSTATRIDLSKLASIKPVTRNNIDYGDLFVSQDSHLLLELVYYYVLIRKGRRTPEVDYKLGGLLGYPECCVKSYVKRGPAKAWYCYQKELIELGLDQEMPIELWAIYHAPCSATCEASIKLGEEYLIAVKGASEKLYRKVVSELSSSHLAYSIGRRFLDFHETKRSIEPSVEKFVAKKLLEPYYILYGKILRPFIYCKWEEGEFKLNITREIEGYKYIAYSPGEGVLVFDNSLKIYIYLTKKILRKDSVQYSLTAFRIYRTKLGSLEH